MLGDEGYVELLGAPMHQISAFGNPYFLNALMFLMSFVGSRTSGYRRS